MILTKTLTQSMLPHCWSAAESRHQDACWWRKCWRRGSDWLVGRPKGLGITDRDASLLNLVQYFLSFSVWGRHAIATNLDLHYSTIEKSSSHCQLSVIIMPFEIQDSIEVAEQMRVDNLPMTKRRRIAEAEPKVLHPNQLNTDEAKLLHVLQSSKKIVVIAGAGISVSAGSLSILPGIVWHLDTNCLAVPDFRSNDGLFATLKERHNFKGSGESLFSASVYNDDKSTAVFHDMIRDLSRLVNQAKPTAFHHMISTIESDGRLKRLYTQNIDGLETHCKPLETTIPLNPKGPWPTTIRLHGGLDKMQCHLCKKTDDFDASLFQGSEAPLCNACAEKDHLRTMQGKRSRPIGRLRPCIVLYDEDHADAEAIERVCKSDTREVPDAVIVVGTSLKVRGVQTMVKSFRQATKAKEGSMMIWVNPDPVPGKMKGLWDLEIQKRSDEIAHLFEEARTRGPAGHGFMDDGLAGQAHLELRSIKPATRSPPQLARIRQRKSTKAQPGHQQLAVNRTAGNTQRDMATPQSQSPSILDASIDSSNAGRTENCLTPGLPMMEVVDAAQPLGILDPKITVVMSSTTGNVRPTSPPTRRLLMDDNMVNAPRDLDCITAINLPGPSSPGRDAATGLSALNSTPGPRAKRKPRSQPETQHGQPRAGRPRKKQKQRTENQLPTSTVDGVTHHSTSRLLPGIITNLSEADFDSLKPGLPLNNKIVETFLCLLAAPCLTVQILCSASQNNTTGHEPSTTLIPIHIPFPDSAMSHWLMAVIDSSGARLFDSMPSEEHTDVAKQKIKELYPGQPNVWECRPQTEHADSGNGSVDSGVYILVHAIYLVTTSLGSVMQLPDSLDFSLWRDVVTALLRASHGLSYNLSWAARLDTIVLQGRPSPGNECACLHCHGPITIKYKDAFDVLTRQLRYIEAARKDAEERKATVAKKAQFMRDILDLLSEAVSSPENESYLQEENQRRHEIYNLLIKVQEVQNSCHTKDESITIHIEKARQNYGRSNLVMKRRNAWIKALKGVDEAIDTAIKGLK